MTATTRPFPYAPWGSVKATMGNQKIGDKLVGLTLRQKHSFTCAAYRAGTRVSSRQVGDKSYQLTRVR